MSGIGEINSLTTEHIREAFETARERGADYLLKVGYASPGEPMGMTGSPVLLDMVDLNQATHSIKSATAAEDLWSIYERYNNLHIIEVYDLSRPFNCAAGGTEILPQEPLNTVRSRIQRAKQENAVHKPTTSRKSWLSTILGDLGLWQ